MKDDRMRNMDKEYITLKEFSAIVRTDIPTIKKMIRKLKIEHTIKDKEYQIILTKKNIDKIIMWRNNGKLQE